MWHSLHFTTINSILVALLKQMDQNAVALRIMKLMPFMSAIHYFVAMFGLWFGIVNSYLVAMSAIANWVTWRWNDQNLPEKFMLQMDTLKYRWIHIVIWMETRNNERGTAPSFDNQNGHRINTNSVTVWMAWQVWLWIKQSSMILVKVY